MSAFGQFLGKPSTGHLLDRLLADNAAVDRVLQADAEARERPGPRQCCAEYAIVERCDGETDVCFCGVCDRRWSQPCAVGDFVPAVER